jgi:hypothetical protein
MAAHMNPLIAARESDYWPPVNQLLLKATALFATIALCGCSHSPKSFEQMSEEEQLNFLRAQADSAMLVQATNRVPNIHAVLEENADTFSGSVAQWRGWVRLDYADPSGGIQQTNIPMTFVATFEGHLFGCAPSGSCSSLLDIK